MEILVNDVVKDLTIVNADGIDWASDFLGNADALGHDDEREMPTLSEDDFKWWADYLPKYQAASEAVAEFKQSLTDTARFDAALHAATNCDLEDQPAAMLQVIEDYQ